VKKFFAITLVMLTLIIFAACDGNDGNEPEPAETENDEPPIIAELFLSIEELGETIVATGEFWNRWWASHHTFEWEHIDDSQRNWQPWDETLTPSHHPLSRGFAILLPSSGFANANDLTAELAQFYTQAWLDAGIFVEPLVTTTLPDGTIAQVGGIGGIEEYDGQLYVFIQVESTLRPDWRTATHTLIWQDSNCAEVETVVQTYIYGYYPDYEMPTITYRFTFVNGRIDSVYGYRQDAEIHQAFPEYEEAFPHNNYEHQADFRQDFPEDETEWQGFYAVLNGMILSINRAEDVDLERLDGLHSFDHTILWEAQGYGEEMIITATEPIFDVSMIHFQSDWHWYAGEQLYTMWGTYAITDTLNPREALHIHGFTQRATMPWSGISFYDAHGERHFFAIHHDLGTVGPSWYTMWDITSQIRFDEVTRNEGN